MSLRHEPFWRLPVCFFQKAAIGFSHRTPRWPFYIIVFFITACYLWTKDNTDYAVFKMNCLDNKRLQQSWLLSRFLLSQEHVPMPRGRSAAKQLNRTLPGQLFEK